MADSFAGLNNWPIFWLSLLYFSLVDSNRHSRRMGVGSRPDTTTLDWRKSAYQL